MLHNRPNAIAPNALGAAGAGDAYEIEPAADAILTEEAGEPSEVRRLVPARDDLRPLYLNTPGLRVGKSGAVLKVQEKNRLVEEVRIQDICQRFGRVSGPALLSPSRDASPFLIPDPDP